MQIKGIKLLRKIGKLRGANVTSKDQRKAAVVAMFKACVEGCTKVTLVKDAGEGWFCANCLTPARRDAQRWSGSKVSFDTLGYWEFQVTEWKAEHVEERASAAQAPAAQSELPAYMQPDKGPQTPHRSQNNCPACGGVLDGTGACPLCRWPEPEDPAVDVEGSCDPVGQRVRDVLLSKLPVVELVDMVWYFASTSAYCESCDDAAEVLRVIEKVRADMELPTCWVSATKAVVKP